jgi:hypothetical protein
MSATTIANRMSVSLDGLLRTALFEKFAPLAALRRFLTAEAASALTPREFGLLVAALDSLLADVRRLNRTDD